MQCWLAPFSLGGRRCDVGCLRSAQAQGDAILGCLALILEAMRYWIPLWATGAALGGRGGGTCPLATNPSARCPGRGRSPCSRSGYCRALRPVAAATSERGCREWPASPPPPSPKWRAGLSGCACTSGQPLRVGTGQRRGEAWLCLNWKQLLCWLATHKTTPTVGIAGPRQTQARSHREQASAPPPTIASHRLAPKGMGMLSASRKPRAAEGKGHRERAQPLPAA